MMRSQNMSSDAHPRSKSKLSTNVLRNIKMQNWSESMLRHLADTHMVSHRFESKHVCTISRGVRKDMTWCSSSSGRALILSSVLSCLLDLDILYGWKPVEQVVCEAAVTCRQHIDAYKGSNGVKNTAAYIHY